MPNIDRLQIDPERTTVGEVVTQNYNSADVFRQFGLDFCCGGGVPIKTACDKKDVDMTELMDRLQTLETGDRSGEDNYKFWEIDPLIRHIVSIHHNFVRYKSVEISFYAEKVARVHGDRYPENVKINEQFGKLSKGLLHHLEAEEKSVFPLIRAVYEKRLSGEVVEAERVRQLRQLLDEMVDEHENAGSVMASIRELSRDYTPPEDACTTYRILYQNLEDFEKDLHKHVHLENNILFKKAEKLV